MNATLRPTTTTTTTTDFSVAPTPARAETGRRTRLHRFVGAMFILGALLVNIPYALLIANFEYPDVLREPTATILTEFAEGGDGLVFTWLAFAWSGLPILIAILGLRQILEAEGRHPWIGAATTVGVIGVVVQLVGLLRWVFVVPGLAAAHAAPGASDSARTSAEVTFDAVHQYGGVVIGEHLGQLFTIAWIVMIAVMMFRSSTFPRWLGWFGLVAAAVYGVAQLELINTVIDGFPYWGDAGLIGSLLWLVWMLAIGIRLVTMRLVTSDAADGEPSRAPRGGSGDVGRRELAMTR